MKATKVSWSKVRKAIARAAVMYLYTDGSLLLRTEDIHRGVRVDVFTRIVGFVPAFSVRYYSPDVENGALRENVAGRIVFFDRAGTNKGTLTLARPIRAEAWCGGGAGSERSRAANLGLVGLRFTYPQNARIEMSYLSAATTLRPNELQGWNEHLVTGDFEVQTGPFECGEVDELWTLDDAPSGE